MEKSENQILSEAFKSLWNYKPEIRYCFFHVANEAKRTPIEWSQLKAIGFTKGIQDIHFLFNRASYHIEMKTPTGRIDPWQAVVHCAHFNQGFPTYIFRTSQDLVNFVISAIDLGEQATRESFKLFHSPYCLPSDHLPILIKKAKSK